MRLFLPAIVLCMWSGPIAVAEPLAAADAVKHVGEEATVCGKIAEEYTATDSRGTKTLIPLDRAHPIPTFTVAIWDADRRSVGGLPTSGMLCAVGVISENTGNPEIVIRNSRSWYVPTVERGSVGLTLKLLGASLSAILGVIAVLGDFRNKRTKRLTNAGRLTLVGLLLGALLSIVTELVENEQKMVESIKNENAAKANEYELGQVATSEMAELNKTDAIITNTNTIASQSTTSLNLSSSALQSTQNVLTSTKDVLLQVRRTQNPLTDHIAVVFEVGAPESSHPALVEDLRNLVTAYLSSIRAADDSGHPMQSEDVMVPVFRDSPASGPAKHGADEYGPGHAFDPEPGVSLVVDSKGRATLISVQSNSAPATRITKDEDFFSQADRLPSWHILLFNEKVEALSMLTKYPANIDWTPVIAADGFKVQDAIEEEREGVQPLVAAVTWDIPNKRVFAFYSARLRERKSDGIISSTLDLPRTTLYFIPGKSINIKAPFTFCFVDVFAGGYEFSVPVAELERHSPNPSVNSSYSFRLPAQAMFLPSVPTIDRLSHYQRPSDQNPECR